MKTVKLTVGHLIDGVHREPDDVVIVVDEIASQLLKLGHAVDVPPGAIANGDANLLAEAVNPLVPDADPLHAARALGVVIDEHPGLAPLADAVPGGLKQGKVRSGRVKSDDYLAPDALATTDAPSPAPVVGPPVVPATPDAPKPATGPAPKAN